MENELYKPDKKTTDRAWDSMQEMLDAEMPRRRRRFVFWWLAGLSIIPLFLVAGWQFRKLSGAGTPAIPREEKQPENLRTSVPVAAGASSGSGLSSPVAQTPVVSEMPGANNSSVLGKTNPAPSISRAVSSLPSASNTNSLSGTETPQTPENATNKPAFTQYTTAAVAAPELLPLVQILPEYSRDITPLHFTVPVAPIQTTPRRQGKFALSAMTGIQTRDFSRVDGFTAGSFVDWKPRRQWGLRAGLGYRQERTYNYPDYAVALSQNGFYNLTGIDAYGNSNFPLYGPDSTPVLIRPSRLHYLQAPVQVFWQPLSFLRLYSGVQANYLLSARVANQYAIDVPTNVATTDNESEKINTDFTAESVEALEAVLQEKLPRWSWEAQVGLGFPIGKHIELGVQYYFPLKNAFSQHTSESADALNVGGQSAIGSGNQQRSSRFLATFSWRF